MVRRPSHNPTDSELAVLDVLWRRGPSTVREVHQDLAPDGEVRYTTVLKTLQIMTDKGLVRRDETERAHVYEPAITRDRAQRDLVGDLAARAFSGSAARLAMQALAGQTATPEEIAAIRELLDRLEKEDA
jgi:predicted transcriptional regulator